MKEVKKVNGTLSNGVLEFNLNLKIQAKTVKCKQIAIKSVEAVNIIGNIYLMCFDDIQNPLSSLKFENYQSADTPSFTTYTTISNPNIKIPLSNYTNGIHKIIFYTHNNVIASGIMGADTDDNAIIAILEFED